MIEFLVPFFFSFDDYCWGVCARARVYVRVLLRAHGHRRFYFFFFFLCFNG